MYLIEKKIDRLAKTLGKDDHTVRQLLTVSCLHPERNSQILRSLQAYAIQNGLDPTNLPLFSGNITMLNSGIHLGTIMIGNKAENELWISLEDLLNAHVMVLGLTGSGKSTFIEYILDQLIQSGIRIIVFDSEGEYWSLSEKVGLEKCWNIRVDLDDRDNCLEPPTNVSFKHWISTWKRSIREVLYCRDGMINLLDTCLKNLNKNLNTESRRRYPTVANLVSLLRNMKFQPGSRHAGYHESLLQRLIGLLDNLGPMLGCVSGYSYEDLAKQSIVYDISHLSPEAQLFVVHLKLFKNMLYREVQFEKNDTKSPIEGTDIVLLEESHRFLSVDKSRQDLGNLALLDAVQTARKKGTRLIFSQQIISNMPEEVLGNVNTRIIGQITDGKSLWMLSQLTGWNDKQLDFIRTLPPRHFVIQTKSTPDGVLVKVPEIHR